MHGTGAPEIYQRTPGQERGAALSPDGKWILYWLDENGTTAIYVQSFPYPGAKYQITQKNALGAGWSRSGDEVLIVTTDGEFLVRQVSTTSGFRQGATTPLFRLPPTVFIVDVQRGEQRFLTGTVKDMSSLSRLEIVLGWTRLLDRGQ
jgi:Tol biopolymer transport system component